MVSSKRARSATLVREIARHAVIHKLASSRPGPCATQVVRLVAQRIAGLRRQHSYAESPGMISVIRPSSVLVTRQLAQRISPSQTVGTSGTSNPGAVLMTLQGQSCGAGGLACANGICTSLDCTIPSHCRHSHFQNADCPSVQCQSAGSTLGLTSACPGKDDRSCQVSCQDPRTANQCVVLQTQLVDGSPCGGRPFIYGDGTIAECGCGNRLRWNVFERNLSKWLSLGYFHSKVLLALRGCC